MSWLTKPDCSGRGVWRYDGADDAGDLSPHEVGVEGEELAAAYLEDIGYEIITRNWRKYGGEVDIIAEDGDTTVLVEVKTRLVKSDDADAIPELAVDGRKIARYRRLALFYMGEHLECHSVRVDVIAITLTKSREGHIRHLCSAISWDD